MQDLETPHQKWSSVVIYLMDYYFEHSNKTMRPGTWASEHAPSWKFATTLKQAKTLLDQLFGLAYPSNEITNGSFCTLDWPRFPVTFRGCFRINWKHPQTIRVWSLPPIESFLSNRSLDADKRDSLVKFIVDPVRLGKLDCNGRSAVGLENI